MPRKGLSVTQATVPAINTQLALIDGMTQLLDLIGNLDDAALTENVPLLESIGPSRQLGLSTPGLRGKSRIINYNVSGTSGVGETYLTNNAYLSSDGGTWYRDEPACSAQMLRISSNADGFDFFRAASGTGAISWTNTISITSTGVIQVGTWQGTKIGLAYGGSNADLSATGPGFVRQASAGAAFTVGAIGAGDVPDAALTSNVALLNRASQTFTGDPQIFPSIQLTGTTTKYNNVTTAGLGQPYIVASSSLQNQAAAIGTTSLLVTPTAGIYRFSFYYQISQAASVSSAVQLTIGWTAGGAGHTSTGTNVTTNVVGDFSNGEVILRVGSGDITYSTTYSSVGGTSMQYGLFMVVERLQ